MKFKVSDKVYAHIDCNSFFASCEVLRNPSLKWKCVCVWNEIIVAASYEAKRYWIKTGTPLWEAKRILGNKWVFINSDLSYYKKISKRFIEFLTDYSIWIEVFSIDEAFLDITWIDKIYKMDYYRFAIFLKEKILKSIWVPVSIWIADTRIKSKIFSDINKPFWECVVFDLDKLSLLFNSLSIWEVPFIWKSSSEKLKFIASTIEDYRRLSFWKVKELLWKNWTDLWLELNWVDVMNFKWNIVPKSISRTNSFNKEITSDKDYIWARIMSNFNSAFWILNKYNLEAKTISIYLRDKDFRRYLFDFNLMDYTNIYNEFIKALRHIFFNDIPFDNLYRSAWVFLNDFREIVPKQLSLMDFDNKNFEKNKKLIESMEFINRKFWNKIVNIGVLNN